MNTNGQRLAFYGAILILSLIAPWALPAYQTQLAFLWMMVIFALTWDIVGGQMGYNSFGINALHFLCPVLYIASHFPAILKLNTVQIREINWAK